MLPLGVVHPFDCAQGQALSLRDRGGAAGALPRKDSRRVAVQQMRGSLSRKGQKSLAQPFRGCYETVPSLRDSNRISHLTRHFAYGFVPGYDCFVPAALDFDNLVPPSSERIEFGNSLLRPGLILFRPAGWSSCIRPSLATQNEPSPTVLRFAQPAQPGGSILEPLQSLRRKSEINMPRGLKSARRVENRCLVRHR